MHRHFHNVLLTASFLAKELLQAGADERYVQRIASAETEEDLDDLSDYFHFYYSDLVERRKVRTCGCC